MVEPDEFPIKFGPVSNGEFYPVPHSPVVRETIRRTHELADANARRLGMSRPAISSDARARRRPGRRARPRRRRAPTRTRGSSRDGGCGRCDRKSRSENHCAFFAQGVANAEISASAPPTWTRTPGRIVDQSMPETVTFSPAAPGVHRVPLGAERVDHLERPEAQRLQRLAVMLALGLPVAGDATRADRDSIVRPLRYATVRRAHLHDRAPLGRCAGTEGVQPAADVAQVMRGVVHGVADDPGRVGGLVTGGDRPVPVFVGHLRRAPVQTGDVLVELRDRSPACSAPPRVRADPAGTDRARARRRSTRCAGGNPSRR